MIIVSFFITIAVLISYIDAKKELIPDKIIVPAIFVLLFLKYLNETLNLHDFLAAFIVFSIFLIPIVFNMAFGGGDLRFGVFCALFVGLESIGYFIIIAGLSHLVLLTLLRKTSFGFAPAMTLGALGSYLVANL